MVRLSTLGIQPEDSLWGRMYAVDCILRSVSSEASRVLNLGCKDTDLGGINADIIRSETADVQANALKLPFKENSFDVVVFSEVLEHLPRGTEIQALKEINRVLTDSGWMILTTPIDTLVYTYSDPYFFLRGHRHYKVAELLSILAHSGFSVLDRDVRGGIEDRIWTWTHFVFVILMKKPLPLIIRKLLTRAYLTENSRGSTIFVVGRPAVAGLSLEGLRDFQIRNIMEEVPRI